MENNVLNQNFRHIKDLSEISERRVSYILITKDRGECLKKILPAFKGLITPADELIVVDGASRDNTAEVVFNHSDIISVFISEKDVNQTHAINKGVLVSRGKYVVLLFDEDTVRPDAIERAVKTLEANPEVGVLVCGGIKHFKTKGFSRPFYYPPGTNYGSKPEDVFVYGACANGFVIRRSVFAKVGLFQLDAIGCDLVFIAQTVYHGGVVKFCRINLFDHYINEQSASHRKNAEINAEKTRFAERYCSPEFFAKYELRHMGPVRFLKLRWYKKTISYWLKILRREGIGSVAGQVILRRKKHIKHAPPPEYIWDGGFS